MKLSRNQLILNAIFCTALLAVIVWALYAEYDRPWKRYQKGKIQQLYFQDIEEVDRCITCHQGLDKPDSGSKPQPFKSHSGNYLKQHTVEKFGCVACHEGQGAALTADAAHGNVRNWPRPVLKGMYAQSSCMKCHPMVQELPQSVSVSGAPALVEGWRLFNQYNCLGCHNLALYKRPEFMAPSLTSAKGKIKRDWLTGWLKNPREYLPNAKMPRFDLSDEEIGYMADYLTGRGTARRVPTGNPEQITKGKNILTSLGCLGCHTIEGNGNKFAPDLSGIGSKVNADWLLKFLIKPVAYQSGTSMPNLNLSDKDIQGVAAYLMSLREDRHSIENPPPSPFVKVGLIISPSLVKRGEGRFSTNIAKGKKLLKDKGCTGCHEIEDLRQGYDAPPLDGIGDKRTEELVFSNIAGIDKTLINWMMIKVMNPNKFATGKIVTRMPDYGFSEQQAAALTTFLLSLKKASQPLKYTKGLFEPDKIEMRGEKVLEKYNCTGCHKISGEYGAIAPELTGEGKRVRPEWLFTYLKKPFKIRPLLNASMPAFNISDNEINSLVEYLCFISGEIFPYVYEAKKDVTNEDIADGEKLYQEVLACSGCHRVDGRGGQVGPDHSDIGSRLRRDGIAQWLRDPQSVRPDARMPKFRLEDWQFAAVSDYLQSLGRHRFVDMKRVE